jgi:hypothetical protein
MEVLCDLLVIIVKRALLVPLHAHLEHTEQEQEELLQVPVQLVMLEATVSLSEEQQLLELVLLDTTAQLAVLLQSRTSALQATNAHLVQVIRQLVLTLTTKMKLDKEFVKLVEQVMNVHLQLGLCVDQTKVQEATTAQITSIPGFTVQMDCSQM